MIKSCQKLQKDNKDRMQQLFLYSEFKIILQKKAIESHESWEGGKYRHETTSVQHVWWNIDWVSKAKISVTSMKLDFITFEVQGQLSKWSKAKISVTSMKLHFITFEVNGPRSISKVNYAKYLKQKFRWPLFSWKYTSSVTKK